MRGYRTTFSALFDEHPDGFPPVDEIEIPLIQRDYAQGRKGGRVEEIRTRFLGVLHAALVDNEPVDLDFVYGDVADGTMRPLDGQQRLTTLFLLHWYLASRTGRLTARPRWAAFSYATRPSARTFCQRLVDHAPPADVTANAEWVPQEWIVDQPWYLHVWRNDPTIQSMLVMSDAIHAVFADDDAETLETAWQRLVDREDPAISFQLLQIQETGAGEELYVKMNSRGKPLTPFENFKARFEQTIAHLPRGKVEDFARKVDGAWSDLMWHHRGDDNIVDDEFMRYFEFIIEICEWQEGVLADGALEPRAERVFGPRSGRAEDRLDFLLHAFDVWESEEHIAATFAQLFTTTEGSRREPDTSKVVIFGSNIDVNLFESCCRTYGEMRGPTTRLFPFGQTLLLYAVLLHLSRGTDDFPRRLRILRNLIAASDNQLRRDNMPKLVAEVDTIILEGTLDGVATFNQAQVADEVLKQNLIARHPEVAEPAYRLEDHALLRGSLAAFELDAATLDQRGRAFDRAFSDPSRWPALTGALLATGEYQRKPWSAFRFGTGSSENESVWRWILTGSRRQVEPTRRVLGEFLDGTATAERPIDEHLARVSAAFLERREEARTFDWRYYLVRYDCMREGASGLYLAKDGALGYSMIMLRKTRLSAYYRDPYLLAMWRESGVGPAVKDPWFRFDENAPRWMEFERSSTRLRNVERGLILKPPSAPEQMRVLRQICGHRDDIVTLDGEWLLRIPQELVNGAPTDIVDRVQIGATLLRELAAAGL